MATHDITGQSDLASHISAGLVAGDTYNLAAGHYTTRHTFSADGTSGSHITINCAAGVIFDLGFIVSGDYYDFNDGTITSSDATLTTTTGHLFVTGNNNTFDGLLITGCTESYTYGIKVNGGNNTFTNFEIAYSPGVYVTSGGTGNTFSNGEIHHTNQSCGTIRANNTTFENLDLHDPGQVGPDADNWCDGLNINTATNVTINNCRIYNIFQTGTTHSDAIQWWTTVNDLTVSNCVIGSTNSGGGTGERDHGHIMVECQAGSTNHRVTFTNNIFLGTQNYYYFDINGGGDWGTGTVADDWLIANNTFCGTSSEAAPFRSTGFFNYMRNATVRDNVFHKRANVSTMASGGVWTNNAYVNSTVDPVSTNTVTTTDAMFVDDDRSAANDYGRSADFHLLAGSPLLNADTTGSGYIGALGPAVTYTIERRVV